MKKYRRKTALVKSTYIFSIQGSLSRFEIISEHVFNFAAVLDDRLEKILNRSEYQNCINEKKEVPNVFYQNYHRQFIER